MKHIGPIRPIGLMIALLFSACSSAPPPGNSNSNSSVEATPSPSSSASPLSNFEERLQFIRNGQYTYIWVFSRKDGKPLEPADSIFLRANAPQVVDWVTTDDRTKAIAGTNFNLEEGNLELLRKRYVTEDYSNK